MSDGRKNVGGQGSQALYLLRLLRDANLQLTEFALCVAIALRTNAKSGKTFASVARLARDAKLAERTARRDLARLKSLGVIQSIPRAGKTSLLSLDAEAVKAIGRPNGCGGNVLKSPLHHGPQPVNRVQAPPARESVEPLHRNQPNSPDNSPPDSLSSAAEDDLESLAKKLERFLPRNSKKQIRWAIRLVRARARTTPMSEAYYRKALPSVFASLEREICQNLSNVALEWLQQAGPESLRIDLAEELKTMCAHNDLPYSSDLVGEALDNAEARYREERELRTMLSTGGHTV